MAVEIKLFGTRIVPAIPHDEKDDEGEGQEAVEAAKAAAAAVVGLPCPRCKSKETKFCYFNNYNVNQPRHFCRDCQRYWTAGGALRNVPVGAGRRKTRPPPHAAADVTTGALFGYYQHQPPQHQYLFVGHEGFPAKRPNNGINGLQERIC